MKCITNGWYSDIYIYSYKILQKDSSIKRLRKYFKNLLFIKFKSLLVSLIVVSIGIQIFIFTHIESFARRFFDQTSKKILQTLLFMKLKRLLISLIVVSIMKCSTNGWYSDIYIYSYRIFCKKILLSNV